MKKTALLLFAVVLVAGCTYIPAQDAEEKPAEVEVQGPECVIAGESCSGTEVTKWGGPAEITVEINNYGDTPLTVDIGDNGRDVMVSKCNDQLASITDFSMVKQSPSEYDEIPDPENESMELGADTVLKLNWVLDIVPGDGDVSRLGTRCPMDFQASFVQEIESSRQIQIKRNEDVADVSSLDSDTSSKYPVKLVIDAPESFVPSIGDTERKLTVKSYLENVGSGEVEDVERIDGGSFLEGDECKPDNSELDMYGAGKRAGQSYRKICNVDVEAPDSRSNIEWLEFEGEYSYTLPIGSASIEVGPTAGG